MDLRNRRWLSYLALVTGRQAYDIWTAGWNHSLFYGVIPTFQPATFGRVYAAYGGIFIVLSILWGWKVDQVKPDLYDIIGAAVALIGVFIIMYWPRS